MCQYDELNPKLDKLYEVNFPVDFVVKYMNWCMGMGMPHKQACDLSLSIAVVFIFAFFNMFKIEFTISANSYQI